MIDLLDCFPCDTIDPRQIYWLWKPYLACGKIAMLDGDPGTGKSFLAIDLAARISRGGPLPDGQKLSRPGNTLLLSAEDDARDTILPRVQAAGADPNRVRLVAPGLDTRLPIFPDDLGTVTGMVQCFQADLLIIDPIMAFFGTGVWANSDQSVRRVFTELSLIAAETRCAILVIRHLIKTGGLKAIYRGSGSIGMIGACRTGLLAGVHPDDPSLRVLSMTKTNVGSPGKSLAFQLVGGPEETDTRVEWLGRADLTATDLCMTPTAAGTRPRDRAREWLRLQLAGGKKKASEIEAAAREEGIAYRTLERAKVDLGVVAEKGNGERGEWWWHDPEISKPKSKFDDILEPLPPLEDPLLDERKGRKGKKDGSIES